MNIELIIFDCFGVIVNESAPVWLLSKFPPDKADFLNRTVVRNGDLGRISGKETFEIMGREAGMDGDSVLRAWLDLAQRREDTFQTILQLRKTHKTALLSNAIDGLIEGLFTREELDSLFDYRVVSCEVGYAKPDKEIYELLLRQAGVKPERAVFTDDNPANLVPAQALGIRTIPFVNCKQFKEALEPLL